MSATMDALGRARSGGRIRPAGLIPRCDRHTLFWGLPALIALAYLIVLLANFGSVITSNNMNSDASAALVIGKLIGQAPGGSHVILGNHPYYEDYLFLRATAGLPFYRQLWDVAPLLWTLAGIGLLAWSAKRALGGFAAVLSASALICLGSFARFSFLVFGWHSLGVLHTILIGAALVWLAPRAAGIGWIRLLAFATLLGLVSVLPAASDKQFPFWALIPMLVATVVMAWRGAGRARLTLPAFAITTIIVTALGGALLGHIMRSDGVTAAPFPITFVGPGSIVNNIELLFEGYMNLGGGHFLGMSQSIHSYAVLASGILILAALAFGLMEAFRLARTAGPKPAGGERPTARLAYVSFWVGSLLIQSAAFIGSNAPADILSARYVLAGYVAIAALTGLLALRGPGWRIVVTGGVCVFGLSSIYQLARQPFVPGPPGPSQATQLLRFARSQGVAHAYAGYWDAPDLTWLTKFKLKVYPVQTNCGPAGLCPFPTVQIDSWYRARPGTRSMLIADSKFPGVAALDPGLGPPLTATTIGNLKVAVYPFDIASRL